jgi:hypothetical protein
MCFERRTSVSMVHGCGVHRSQKVARGDTAALICTVFVWAGSRLISFGVIDGVEELLRDCVQILTNGRHRQALLTLSAGRRRQRLGSRRL